MTGFYITIDGPEGCGKSRQSTLLASSFEQAGLPVKRSREPGGTAVAERIRAVLLETEEEDAIPPITELFLFEASRSVWVEKVAKPVLQANETLVADRSFIATIAYQGYGSGISLEIIAGMNNIALAGIYPDLAIIIDIDIDTALDRMNLRSEPDRFERKERAYHERVRKGFCEYAESGKAVLLDGTPTVPEVHASVIEVVNRHLGLSLQNSSY